MVTIKKSLNEWNATIEALGHGMQTILIRKYGTTLDSFLLNPTVSYTLQNNYLENFQKKYQPFVEKNSHPKKEDNKREIKYYAKVDKIVNKSYHRIAGLNKYHIWTNSHVKSYIGSDNPKIWILRVYKLKEPVMAQHGGGQTYVNLTKPVSLEGIQPVLSDSEFNKIKNAII